MSDFFQNGVITNLHRLGSRSLENLEADLAEHTKVNPIALLLPSLISELEGPALGPIVQQLSSIAYIEEIVVAHHLDRGKPGTGAHPAARAQRPAHRAAGQGARHLALDRVRPGGRPLPRAGSPRL
jgi:hypothetical protein